uniref:Uncharacterized protein n=1 Tax=Rhizophora mucronata TaxID=61149 RepID=A0A2P2J7V9_RHIMU
MMHMTMPFKSSTPAPIKGQSYKACKREFFIPSAAPNPIFASL